MKRTNLGITFKKGTLFFNLDNMFKIIKHHHKMMTTDKDDKVIAVVGNTGSGKSTLIKHIYDYYYTNILNIKPEEEDLLKFFCHTDQDYAEALHEAKDKKHYMIVHDEAVNILYSKETITKKNRSIAKLFNIIRAKQYYHIFAIPKIWRLDREIKEDRLKGLINVIKVGKFRYACYYNARELPYLFKELEVMRKVYKDSEHEVDIKLCKTMPTIVCQFPDYQGWVQDMYDLKKEENMNNAIDEVYQTISDKTEKAENLKNPYTQKKLTDKQQRIYDLLMTKIPKKDVAEQMGVGSSVISSQIMAIRKKGYDV